jgi:hypothetical protein
MLRKHHAAQQGQGMVVLAMSAVVLMGFLALAIDGGNAYLQRRVVQKAADAGAMAGAHALALGESEAHAIAAATEYTTDRNGADSADITVGEGATTVTVIARKRFSTFFAAVIGQPSMEVAARSGARFVPVGSLPQGVYPIAVNWQDFVYNQTYDIYAGGGPGNFGWLGWDGCTDSSCLCDNLSDPSNSQNYVNPYDPDDHELSIGDWVPGSTGISTAICIREQLDALIATGTPITILIWDQAQEEGSNLNYRIVGFAEFIVEGYRLPSENRITGRFIRTVNPGTGTGTGGGYGVYRVMHTE